MRVVVREDALATAGETWKLHRLLAYACEGRHVVSFDPPSAAGRCLARFDTATKACYASALALSARTSGLLPANVATIHIEQTAVPRWEDPLAILPLDDALAVLSEPLGIVVENAANDWSFLLGTMRPSEKARVVRAVDLRWVEPIHAGGATMKALLQARLAGRGRGLRTFAMFDSDRRHPRELEAAWAPVPPQACQGYEIEQFGKAHIPNRFWMLARRSIESYIPRRRLEGVPGANAAATAAFYDMAKDARWYFNMKRGFHGDDVPENAGRSLDLYDEVGADARQCLANGFGRSVANEYSAAIVESFDWDADCLAEVSSVMPRLMRLL